MTPFSKPVAFVSILLLFVTAALLAQTPTDQIFKNDGTTVAAKVLEITTGEIKYKKASNPDGPTYTVLKSDITKIIYSNGEVESYAGTAVPTKSVEPKDEIPFGADNFLTFTPDGREVITDLTLGDKKTYLCYWSYDSKLKKKLLFDNRDPDQGLYNWQIKAEDGSYLKSACLYDKDNKLLTTFINPKTNQAFGNSANGGIISPDGKRISIKVTDGSGGKGYVYLFNNTGTLLKTIKNDSWNGLGAWKFSPNSAYLLFSGGKGLTKKGIISVFDADGNSVSQIMIGNTYEDVKYYLYDRYGNVGVKAFMDFSFDGQMIIAADNDETVGIWDIKGNLIKSLPHFHAKMVALSRDGKMAVTVGGLPFGKEEIVNGKTYSGGQIKLWSIDGTLIKEIPFPTNPSSIEFVPDNAGIVVTVEGSPIWLWANNDYKLPDGYEKMLPEVAKMQEESRAAQRASEKRARHEAMWTGFATGFVEGMAKAGKELDAMNKKTAEQEKFIDNQVNKALADCRYAVFTQIQGDYIAISKIFKLNRGCELNSGGANVQFGNTYEEVDKWVNALIAKEEKLNGRGAIEYAQWNDHFKNAAYAGQGGCLCK